MVRTNAQNKTFADALQDLEAGKRQSVYLLTGDEFLLQQAVDRLLARLVPQGTEAFNLVTLESVSPKEIVTELVTLPMFAGHKVVLLRDPEFLAPKKNRSEALGQALETWRNKKNKGTARRVLALCARAGVRFDDLATWKPGVLHGAGRIEFTEANALLLQEVVAYCRSEGIAAPSGDETHLLDWLFRNPQGQVLVIAAVQCEMQHAFVKRIKEQGAFFEFKSTSKSNNYDSIEFIDETLEPFQKQLAPGALEALYSRIGHNFRQLQSELVKLALYTQSDVITRQDVELIVSQVRENEFFALSDAIQKRSIDTSLRLVEEALAQGNHPLMLLGTITNVVRRMVVAREQLQHLAPGKPLQSFNDFKSHVWPAIEKDAKASKAKVPHPYAAFMVLQAASHFDRHELLCALAACAEADLALKLGGHKLVLERLLWTLCGKVAVWDSQMHFIRRGQER